MGDYICKDELMQFGIIRKKYSGSFCLECGAEVKEGDAE